MNKLTSMIGLAGLAFASTAVSAAEPTAARGAMARLKNCESLSGTHVNADAIGLPTKGAVVTSAVQVAATGPTTQDGDAILPIAAHCQLQGEIASVTAGAPPIQFNINLPLTWNGVALQSGGGGMGGAVITAPKGKASGMIDPDSPAWPYRISTGYVTFGSNEGHVRGDFSFYQNDEAMQNWSADFLKKARDTALPLIAKAYGVAARRIYLTGESAGGRETVRASQRFPTDYDGFIATSPVIYWSVNHIADNATRSLLIDGWIDSAAITTIATRVRAACDDSDGLKDGVVARYMECKIAATELGCKDGKAGSGCLSGGQVAALDSLWRGWKAPAGIILPYGITNFPGYGVTGNEDGDLYQYNYYPVGKVPPSRDLPPGLGFEKDRGAVLNFGASWVRHAIARDPAFNPYKFDPLPYAARIKQLSAQFDANDPDLTPMVARGSKLIIYEPSADNAAGLPPVAAYYRSVVRKLGAAQADKVLRLYVGPGGGHNVTGTGHVDLLKVMEAWVDDRVMPPSSLVAQKVDDATLKVSRTMPACLFPAYARYRGKGDPNVASSFVCEARPALAAR